MNIYWSLNSIPGLQDLAPAHRARIWRKFYPQAFSHWQIWLSLLACGVCTCLGLYLGIIFSRNVSGTILGYVFAIILGSIGAGVGVSLFNQTVAAVLRPYFREYRAEVSEDYFE